MRKIKRNAAQCKKCGDIIESKKRVGGVKCSCGSLIIEGGKFYIKRSANPEDYVEMSEYEEV